MSNLTDHTRKKKKSGHSNSSGNESIEDPCKTPVAKRSARLRIKSQKGASPYAHHDQQYVYDYGALDLSDSSGDNLEIRPRSSSWSNAGAAVVERRLNRKKGGVNVKEAFEVKDQRGVISTQRKTKKSI